MNFRRLLFCAFHNTFIADLVLQILSFVAQTESENIRSRQAQGIAAAKSKGVRFGRPRRNLPDCFAEVYSAWRERKITRVEAARLCGMSVSSFYRCAKNIAEK